MKTTKRVEEEDKGVPIKFIGGTYSNERGWINANRQPTACYTYVIVFVTRDSDGTDIGTFTRVKHHHVKARKKKSPIKDESAWILSDPDIKKAVNKLALKLHLKQVSLDSTVAIEQALKMQMLKFQEFESSW